MSINGIPKSERIWVTHKTEKGETFYITSKESRDCYFIYKEEKGKAVKLGKASSPVDLEKKYIGIRI